MTKLAMLGDVEAAAVQLRDAAYKKALEILTDELKHHEPTGHEETGHYGRSPVEAEKQDIRDDTAWIISRYAKYTKPDPKSFSVPIAAVQDIWMAFPTKQGAVESTAFEKIDTAKGRVDDWEGEFGENLVENYLTPLPQICYNHGVVAYYLAQRMSDMRAIYQNRQDNAIMIAEKATEAIESIVVSKPSDGLNWLFAGLIVAGTAAAGVAAFLTAPGMLAAAGSTLIIGGTLGQAGAPSDSAKGEHGVTLETEGEDKTFPLDGDDVMAVLDRTREALVALDKGVAEAEARLIEDLRKSYSFVWRTVNAERKIPEPGEEGNTLVPIIPDMVGADGEEFTGGGLTPDDRDGGPTQDDPKGGGRGSYMGPDPRSPGFEGSWTQVPT